MTITFRPVVLCASVLALAACTGGEPSSATSHGAPAATTAGQTFTSKAWGFVISYPADFQATPGFSHSYLQNGAWKTYAGPRSKGQPVVALVLAGSNDVTDAVLRIGASRDPQSVAACTRPSDAMRPGSLGQAKLDGLRFVTFRAGDAAMSHYLLVRSYRAVHEGACYALDLLVYGTNPKVYSPPRTPPFTHKEAFARLQTALEGFRFIR
ncbi:MAG: hypothetical protein ACRESR_08415 [Gammaproteobacteria bacterium]